MHTLSYVHPLFQQDIGDIVIGSVLGPSSQRANEARIASLFAGIPDTVPVHTVNRQCSSGLQAIASVAAAIKAGFYKVICDAHWLLTAILC